MKTEAIKINDSYSTTDLTTAVTLSLYFPIETIDKSNPRKAIFLFRRNKEFNKTLEQYWRGELRVSPQAFAAQMKVIKTRLYWEK